MSAIKKFATSKIYVIEAIQWTGTFQIHKEVTEWLGEGYDVAMVEEQGLAITDMETDVCYICEVDNYIVKRDDGTVILLGKYKVDRLYTEL